MSGRAVDASTHYVYELRRSDQSPLYIGCTSNLGRRFLAHVQKAWWGEVANVTAVAYPNYEGAMAAEHAQILAAKPTHNRGEFTDRRRDAHATRRAHLAGEPCGGCTLHPLEVTQ